MAGLLLAGATCLFGWPAKAAVVSMDPLPPAGKGMELAVQITVDNVADPYGLALDMVYDPATLEVVDGDPSVAGVQPKVSEGVVLNENGAVLTILRAALQDGKQGTLVLGLTRTDTTSGLSSTGNSAVVLTVYFRPLVTDTVGVDFANQAIRDVDQLDLTIDGWQGGSVNVQPTYIIATTAVGNGQVQPSGQVAVLVGQSQNFVMQAESGYAVGSLIIDGRAIPPLPSYSFTNINKDYTFQVKFRRLPGDFNGDTVVDLADAILSGQVMARGTVSQTIYPDADPDGIVGISASDLVYILQKVAGVR